MCRSDSRSTVLWCVTLSSSWRASPSRRSRPWICGGDARSRGRLCTAGQRTHYHSGCSCRGASARTSLAMVALTLASSASSSRRCRDSAASSFASSSKRCRRSSSWWRDPRQGPRPPVRAMHTRTTHGARATTYALLGLCGGALRERGGLLRRGGARPRVLGLELGLRLQPLRALQRELHRRQLRLGRGRAAAPKGDLLAELARLGGLHLQLHAHVLVPRQRCGQRIRHRAVCHEMCKRRVHC